MALKTLVKVGSITNLSDARYCAGMGVDFLGFKVIDGQPDAVSAKFFQEIRGWITGPQIVAEVYGIKNSEELTLVIENFQPDYFEMGLAEFKQIGSAVTIPFILRLKNDESLPPLSVKPAYVLIDAEAHTLSPLIPEFDVLAEVSGPDSLQKALQHTGISGVSLNGGQEIRPGLKSFDELAEILEALEEE